jgi:hypothetical protein
MSNTYLPKLENGALIRLLGRNASGLAEWSPASSATLCLKLAPDRGLVFSSVCLIFYFDAYFQPRCAAPFYNKKSAEWYP